MTKLSVNINKVATLRNARGGNTPNVLSVALDCENFGAQGITVHPRPDERHIRYQDVRDLRPLLRTEFNIEGFPSNDFCQLVTNVCPNQVTLVPDAPGQLTSNHGWDVVANKSQLREVISLFKEKGIRTSVFIDPAPQMVEAATEIGADRIEMYTEPYASRFPENPEEAIRPFIETALCCKETGIGLNAGHDLNLQNLAYFHQHIPWLDEVSIGHALICDALYLGLATTIERYLACLKN